MNVVGHGYGQQEMRGGSLQSNWDRDILMSYLAIVVFLQFATLTCVELLWVTIALLVKCLKALSHDLSLNSVLK